MVKNQIHLSEEQLRNTIAENVKKALSEDFGAGMRAVGSRLKNDVGGMFGKPSFGREYYGGSYKDTFKDASMESDYWKLGKELESGIVKDNPIVILDKVKKFAEYGVISQESCKKILGLIKRGNYQEAGHELCYGTMSFAAGEDEVGATDYERRHSIRQLEESKLKEIVAESVKRVLKEFRSPAIPSTDYDGNDLNYDNVFYQALKVIDEMNDGVNEIRWQDVARRMGYHLETLNEADMELLHDAIEHAMATPGIDDMYESKTNKNAKKNAIKLNEGMLRKIVAESVKKVLGEQMNNSLSLEEVKHLVMLLKQKPLQDMWHPVDCGFCKVQRVEANNMSGRCSLLNRNDDGTDDLYKEEINGITLIQIGRKPNTHSFEDSGYTYMAWKD